MQNLKTFVVISLGWLGDTLLNSSLCQDIKKNFPDSKLYFITSKPFKEVAMGIPGVDEAFEFDKKGEHKGVFGTFKFANEFPFKNKIDCAIVTHSHERSVMLAHTIGAKKRISAKLKGFNPINMLITNKFEYSEEEIRTTYKGDFNSDYLKVLNAKSRLSKVKFNVPVEFKEKIREKLKTSGLNENERYIVLSPTSKDEYKDWTADNVAKFINSSPLNVVLIGTQKASDMAKELSDCNFIDLTSQTTIFELAALMKNAAATVSVDTGTMHISYAVETPTICLFFKESMINEWCPVKNPNITIVQGEKFFDKEANKTVTVTDIKTEQVLSVLENAIKEEVSAV